MADRSSLGGVFEDAFALPDMVGNRWQVVSGVVPGYMYWIGSLALKGGAGELSVVWVGIGGSAGGWIER